MSPKGSGRSVRLSLPGGAALLRGGPTVTEQRSLLRAPSGPGQQARLGHGGLSSHRNHRLVPILEPSVRPQASSKLNSSTGEVGGNHKLLSGLGSRGGRLEGTELDPGQAQSSARALARGGLLLRVSWAGG